MRKVFAFKRSVIVGVGPSGLDVFMAIDTDALSAPKYEGTFGDVERFVFDDGRRLDVPTHNIASILYYEEKA